MEKRKHERFNKSLIGYSLEHMDNMEQKSGSLKT